MKRRILILGCGLLIAAFFVWMLCCYTSPLAAKFAGTYAAGSGPDQIIFAVNPESSEFFYTDQNSGTYIRGKFEARGKQNYFLFYPNSGWQETLPSQTITCKNTQICVTINGRAVLMEKIANAPVLYADIARYS